MKKSNTLFTLAFFAILAFSSCEREQWGNAQKGPDDIDNRADLHIWVRAARMGRNFQTMIGGEDQAIEMLNLPEFKDRHSGTTEATEK